MKKLLRLFFPLSLRVRFLLATAAVVLVLSLAYGMVALIGYSVSFDKTTFRLLRGESNLFYTLAKWENNKLHVELPENIDKQSPTMTLIYDENGQLLWAQRDVPWLMKMIQPDWLKSNGFHEIEADVNDTSLLLSGDHSIQQQLQEVREDDDDAEMMLRHMGWTEAADLIVKGMEGAINAKTVTYDFERLMEGAKLLKCSEFGDAIIKNM